MVRDKSTETVRVNARKTDAFDLFNFKHYIGPNPYLDAAALAFDFALTEYEPPLPIEEYIAIVSDRYPELRDIAYESYAHLFAQTVAEVGKLDMDLHFNRFSVKSHPNCSTISVQSLHARTTKAVVYFVWDWFEAIIRDKDIAFDEQISVLQSIFRQSAYGGPQSMPCYAQPPKKVFRHFICGKKD